MSLILNNINFKDSAGSSIIQDSGSNNTITSPGNIVLSPSGNIEIANNLNVSNQNFNNIAAISGVNNQDLEFTSQSTFNVLLRSTTGTAATRINIGNTSVTTDTLPQCTAIPSLNTEFMNWNQFTNILSYTPDVYGSSSQLACSYDSRGGRYVQFGNMVWFTMFANLTSFVSTDPTATIRISLPLTPPTGGIITSLSVGRYDNLNTSSNVAVLFAQISGGASRSYFILNKKTSGSSATLTSLLVSDIDQTFQIVVSGTYYLF